MKSWLIAICLIAFIGEGCEAFNSLILHPLSVVHKDHEYNERAAAIQEANSTNHFSNFGGQ